MKLGISAGVDSPLGVRLTYVTALRMLVLTICLVFTELFHLTNTEIGGFSSRIALITVGAAFGISALCAYFLRRGRALKVVAHSQLLVDQLTWTGMVYVSGGVTSGFTSLYGLTCLSGAIVLGTSAATAAAVEGISCYLLLCAGFASGLLPPPSDQSPAAYVTDSQAMVYPAFSTVMAIAVVTLLAVYLAERLRAYGGRLAVVTARAERAESLTRLTAGLAHEIRNPLSSIKGSIELLRTGGTLSEEDQRLCQIVERETSRLNDLVSDLLDLGRPRSPDKQEVDLAGVATAVVELANSSGRGQEVVVQYRGPEQMIVLADAGQMRQILWNLVRNAIQASSAGDEVLVTIERRPDGEVLMAVLDEGSGIDSSTRDKIFDPFFTTRSHGVGIGLTVVKQLATGHDFGLEVRDRQERGTELCLRIPAQSVVSALLLALVAGVLSLSCSPAHEWVNVAPSAGQIDDGQDGWESASGQQPKEPEAPLASSAPAAAAKPAGAPATLSADGPAPVLPPAAEKDLFRNTYYDFPHESDAPATEAKLRIFNAACEPLTTVRRSFHDQVCVQGSGRLLSGSTISFARRDCECAAICPRTDQKICFDLLDQKRFPYGRGATGSAITPLRTVAVDPSVIKLGTVLFIPEYHGLRDLKGVAHDGCFIAEDKGLKVRGRHVDIFTGDSRTTQAWNNAVPSNRGVRVVPEASRCRHLLRQ